VSINYPSRVVSRGEVIGDKHDAVESFVYVRRIPTRVRWQCRRWKFQCHLKYFHVGFLQITMKKMKI